MHHEDNPFLFMRTPNHLSILLLLLCCLNAHAQGVDDAILFSQTYYEGSGRSVAMGNATGAMGGDVTAMCINPAGLGLYRTQELIFSTGLQHTFIGNDYLDNREYDWKGRVSIPNFGYVVTMEYSNYKPLRYLQFGIGMTRTNDFNLHSTAMGLNPDNSMIDSYLQTINGINELHYSSTYPGQYFSDNYPYDLDLAWQTYLIDQYQDSLGYYQYDSPIPQGNVYQNDQQKSKGRSEEWTFAMGSNIKDKFFIGSSVGLAHIKRINTRTYTETPGNSSAVDNQFSSWNHIEELGDTAWGVNIKFGFIYHPVSWFRFGAAWHSRTLYAVGEEWSTETNATLTNNPNAGTYRYISPSLYQTYEFRTPHTFVGNLAFFVGKRGLITADVEYKNYGKSRFSSDVFSFEDANNDIHALLAPTCNFRLGTEWRVHQFFLRGGAAYYGSPYGLGYDYGSIKKLSAGIGYATSDISYWDFAFEITQGVSGYTPYSYYVDGVNMVPMVVQHKWRSKFIATLKFKI